MTASERPSEPGGLGGEFDVADGIGLDAPAVAGVHHCQVFIDSVEDPPDTFDEERSIAFFEVSPAEPAVLEDQVARKEDGRLGGVQTDVVVLVPRRVQDRVGVIPHVYGVSVIDCLLDAGGVGIVPQDGCVEGLGDGVEIPDVVGMGVRQDNGVEVLDVFADASHDVEVVPDVDEHSSVASHEKHVAGEPAGIGGEIVDHTVVQRVETLEPFGFVIQHNHCPIISIRRGRPSRPTGLCSRRLIPRDRWPMSGSEPPVVLIVEDEPDVAETYNLWLQDEYEVRMAESGSEALEMLDESVDVVLLDRMMPGLSGDEVLERIRGGESNCRVAMVTAVEPDFDILEMGFDSYLTKPIRSDELHETVSNLLERSTYDGLLQEYYSLVEKQATLEATKSHAELAESDEYQQLSARVDDLNDELSETLGGVEDDEDFIATLRELSNGDEH